MLGQRIADSKKDILTFKPIINKQSLDLAKGKKVKMMKEYVERDMKWRSLLKANSVRCFKIGNHDFTTETTTKAHTRA